MRFRLFDRGRHFTEAGNHRLFEGSPRDLLHDQGCLSRTDAGQQGKDALRNRLDVRIDLRSQFLPRGRNIGDRVAGRLITGQQRAKRRFDRIGRIIAYAAHCAHCLGQGCANQFIILDQRNNPLVEPRELPIHGRAQFCNGARGRAITLDTQFSFCQRPHLSRADADDQLLS